MRRLLGIALGGLLAVPVAAQQGGASTQLSDRVPAPIAVAVRALADSAAGRGLPTALLFQKAVEGGAKQAPPDRILTAVRQVYGQLTAAADGLKAAHVTATPEAIEAGAFALNAGLGTQDLRKILQTEGASYPPAVSLRVAGALAAIGVPPSDVVDLVDATMAQGGPVADLQSLPSQVQAQEAKGVPPAAAAEGLAQAAAHGSPGGPGNPNKSNHGQGRGRRP